jgi:hypothetical protein
VVIRLISRLGQVRVTVAYAIALAVVAVVLLALGPGVHQLAVSQMSTNLHNLAWGQLDTLVGSAFVTDGDDMCGYLPGLVCLLAFGELVWRSRPMVLAFAVGHIGATLAVAVWLAAAVTAGWLPISIARASDVGISYGAASVLGALTGVLPARYRPAWIGWWLTIAALPVAASDADFTALGHLLALAMGVLLSLRMRARPQPTVTRVVLFVGGVGYCYVFLAGWSVVAPIAGFLAAVLATSVAWLCRTLRRTLRSMALAAAPTPAVAADTDLIACAT